MSLCASSTAKCLPGDGSDNLEELVNALPIDYTSRFSEICWCQGGVGYGWWPACIFNPCLAIGAARTQATKNLGRRHLVYVSVVDLFCRQELCTLTQIPHPFCPPTHKINLSSFIVQKLLLRSSPTLPSSLGKWALRWAITWDVQRILVESDGTSSSNWR